jgi:hypothetical protein
MNRRKFGLLTGSSLTAAAAATATVAGVEPAKAQAYSPDPGLLKTTLTPMGSERAGNADGSIPPWTGGVSAPPLGPNDPQDVLMFQDEEMLYKIDASNMAQYADLLSDGVKLLMTKFGFWVRVFPTHRTHALPQFVYDNNALNVTRAVMEPSGGRFGFTGAIGGYPFPIINTAEPEIGGAQLIWNHLLQWAYGWQEKVDFSSGWVVSHGNVVLTFGALIRAYVPYYDPNMTLDKYDGYFFKLHEWAKAPASSDGVEIIDWHTSNTLHNPDMVWTVVAGQGRVRKAPDEAYDTPNPSANGIGNYDDSNGFDGSPQKYDWKVLGKKEMLVPYNCNQIAFTLATDFVQPGFPNPNIMRWEKHRVWVLEATLHPGERNTTVRRMCYLDEDTYIMQLAEMYDADDQMVKVALTPTRVVPHLPGTIENGYMLWETDSGDYTFIGFMKYPPYDTKEYFGPQPATAFDPQQMAASASF